VVECHFLSLLTIFNLCIFIDLNLRQMQSFFIALTFLIKRNESKVDRGNGHIIDKMPPPLLPPINVAFLLSFAGGLSSGGVEKQKKGEKELHSKVKVNSLRQKERKKITWLNTHVCMMFGFFLFSLVSFVFEPNFC